MRHCQCSYCARASMFQQFCRYLIKSGRFIVFQCLDCSLRFFLRCDGRVYRQVFRYGQRVKNKRDKRFGWFNTSFNCSTQRAFCSSCVSRTFPFLSLMGVAPCPSQIPDHTEQGFGVITFGSSSASVPFRFIRSTTLFQLLI